MRLSITLAARRADLLSETVERTLENIKLPTTTLMIAADEDDPETCKVARKYYDRCAVSIESREDESFGDKFNRVMKVAPADMYLVMVDYAPIITKNFDANILEAASVYPDGYSLVVGPLANLSFHCTYAVSHKMAKKIGGIFPPYFAYWFIDHWLQDVGEMVGRIVYADCLSDFWSRRTGKTLEMRDLAFWAQFFDDMYPEREEQALSIINAQDFDETPGRKAALKRNFPIIKQYSSTINEQCRQNAVEYEKARGGFAVDARYERIKKRAEQALQRMTQAKAA